MKYLLLLLFPALSFGQKTYNIFSIPKANKLLNVGLLKVVEDYTLLDVNTTAILKDKPDSLYLPIIIDGKQQRIKLKKKVYNTKIILSDGRYFSYRAPLNYMGNIVGSSRSVCAITFTKAEVMGIVSNATGNHVIGKYQIRHIMYNDRDVINIKGFVCGTDTKKAKKQLNKLLSAAATNKCVNIYWETDYNVFQSKGSVQAVTDWVNGVFNQVKTIYANDGITINLKTLFIWTTPSPYTGPTNANYFDQFWSYRQSIDGDIGQLIGLAAQGGRAWIGGLCGAPFNTAYCGINISYSVLPTYSWTVKCISHELGHLLGSSHTHDCVWNGNGTAIDGCGDHAGYSSGNCPDVPDPIGGGTIMSYCHLRPVGINFSKGFGNQPRDLMINWINNYAPCLTSCGTPPPPCTIPGQPGAITGSINVLQGSSQSYSIGAVAGAVSYKWILPSGWVGSSVSTSISASVGLTGTISVSAVNSCGSSVNRNLSVNTYTVAPVDSCTTKKLTAKIEVRLKDYKAIGGNGTNYKYRWAINGIQKSTSQLLLKSQVKKGDKVCLVISSLTVTNANCFGKASLIVP